jgi:import inner membrane translocase subunit TIM21
MAASRWLCFNCRLQNTAFLVARGGNYPAPTIRSLSTPINGRLLVSTASRRYTNGNQLDKKSEDKQHHGSVVMEVLSKEEPKQLTVGAKVVQAGRDFTYLIAIVAGFGLMGFLFYSVGSEFFSSTSPSSIFTQALKRVKADERV